MLREGKDGGEVEKSGHLVQFDIRVFSLNSTNIRSLPVAGRSEKPGV